MTRDAHPPRSDALRRPRRRLAPLLGVLLAPPLGVFVASVPSAALAQSPGAPAQSGAAPAHDDFILWQAPVGCSTAAAIRERVSELIGQPEIERERVRRVVGKVSETRDGWELHLTLVDALGARERRLESPHCADLAEAAAVAISLAFEAARARERGEHPGGTSDVTGGEPDVVGGPGGAGATSAAAGAGVAAGAGAELDPSNPRRSPPPDAAEPPAATDPGATNAGARERGEFTPWVGAELWLDAHALPATAGGASVLGALRAGDLRLGAFAAWLPGVERSVAPGQSVSFSLLLGGVRACYTLGHGVIDTALCAGLEAGRLSARGTGLLQARSASDPWLAPQLGLELGSELGAHLALRLRADAFAPLLRQGYAVNETVDVHEVASLGARAAFGVHFGF